MKAARLRLDFAPEARRLNRAGIVLLAVSGLSFATLAAQFGWLWSEQVKHRRALAALQSPHASGAVEWRRPSPDPAEQARILAVRSVAHHLVTPWGDLLDALESAPNQSVALLSVEPSVGRRSIRLTAEAGNVQDMLAYWRALQQDARLTSVVLASHEVLAQAPGTPVRFQLQASWGTAP